MQWTLIGLTLVCFAVQFNSLRNKPDQIGVAKCLALGVGMIAFWSAFEYVLNGCSIWEVVTFDDAVSGIFTPAGVMLGYELIFRGFASLVVQSRQESGVR